MKSFACLQAERKNIVSKILRSKKKRIQLWASKGAGRKCYINRQSCVMRRRGRKKVTALTETLNDIYREAKRFSDKADFERDESEANSRKAAHFEIAFEESVKINRFFQQKT